MQEKAHPARLFFAQIRDLYNSLSKVLSLQHAQEPVHSVIDTFRHADLRLECTIGKPLLQLLLVVLRVCGTHVCVTNDESSHRDTLRHYQEDVTDAVLLLGLCIVLGDHATSNDAAEVVHGIDSSFQMLTTDIFVVDVDAVRSKACERLTRLLLLVVETGIKSKLVDDVVEFVVVTDTTDDLEAFVLGYTASY